MKTFNRAVLTIATGKPLYFSLAINLARSFFLWNNDSKINFFIASDLDIPLPKDLDKVQIIKMLPEQYGTGFSPKLSLDLLSPAEETLFIDSDCLCVANLESVFAKFSACEVSVIGSEESEGELFGDIATRCFAFGISWVPRFCGGMYYFKRGLTSSKVFQCARDLEKRYDELMLVRLRGSTNEEPLLGIAMAVAGQHPIPEDGSIKAEPMFFSGPTEIDVFEGQARLFNLSNRPRPNPQWRIPIESRPAVVHFNCSFADQPPYTTESLRLKKVLHDNWPLFAATPYAWMRCTAPFKIKYLLKAILRPIFRTFFGHRRIKKSPRM